MASNFKVGQLLKGKVCRYRITKEVRSAIWLAVGGREETVIVKTAPKSRLENERDILRHFQHRAPSLRPLIDEIQDPPDPLSIVLKYLDDNLLRASNAKRLTGTEIKYVAKRVLEALEVLHEDGYVHTDIKLDNILVNYGEGSVRFKDVELADCGDTTHVDSPHAKDGDIIGAAIFRSPEAMLNMTWGTATDIWSLGTTLISLIWGEDWHIFEPDVSIEDEAYELKILMKHHQFFGPFPKSYLDIADEDTLGILVYVVRGVLPEWRKPFGRISQKEITTKDRAFISKIMKLDPRDRPTAKELLRDEWFQEDHEDHYPAN